MYTNYGQVYIKGYFFVLVTYPGHFRTGFDLPFTERCLNPK